MTFIAFRIAAMNHAKKELYMVLKLLKTLAFAFRLAITYPDKRQYRRNIQHRQCVRILRYDFARRDQGPEDTGVVGKHPLHISLGIRKDTRCVTRTTEAWLPSHDGSGLNLLP